MAEFLLSSAAIFVLMVGWLYVQDLYARFAARHPELGPFRGQGGCGGSCSCSQGQCTVEARPERPAAPTVSLAARVQTNFQKGRTVK